MAAERVGQERPDKAVASGREQPRLPATQAFPQPVEEALRFRSHQPLRLGHGRPPAPRPRPAARLHPRVEAPGAPVHGKDAAPGPAGGGRLTGPAGMRLTRAPGRTLIRPPPHNGRSRDGPPGRPDPPPGTSLVFKTAHQQPPAAGPDARPPGRHRRPFRSSGPRARPTILFIPHRRAGRPGPRRESRSER